MKPLFPVLIVSAVFCPFVPTSDGFAQDVPVPQYQVDPFWPKVPYPYGWLQQGVPTMTVDDRDHVWVISRSADLHAHESMATFDPPRGDCCIAAPDIIEFDPEGNVVNAWGGLFSNTEPMCGTTYNLAFSHDENQQYVFVADGTNHRVWIHDRFTGEEVGQIGSPGRNAGQLYWIDGIATDSRGNVYTGEVSTGKRVQKFVLQ